MRHTIQLIALLSALAATGQAQVEQTTAHKRLVVTIAIDELRSDYLEAFADSYGDEGFRKLYREGVVYTNASYPFPRVDRAAAVTTIATGATPYYHSIVASRWIDRSSLRPVYCVDDDTPKNIATSTIGDEMKVATGGKAIVYSIAATRDAAVLSGGHAANAAVWIDSEKGKWCSSTYYNNNIPSWLWLYTHGPTSTQANAADSITAIALECIRGTEMGKDSTTDLLSLTYSAGATRTSYTQLDAALSALIKGTHEAVGKDNTLFIITSTGTARDDYEGDYSRFRIPTGTFDMGRAIDLLNLYFGAIYGQGKYIEAGFANHFFLDHKLIEQKQITLTDATTRAKELLLQLAGVRNVYTNLQLLSSDNEHINTIRNGYHPDRCGDVIVEVSPGWKIVNETWSETYTSKYSHLQFPIIIYGSGKEHERINTPVTTERIAPTIAKTIRIRAPNGCSAEPLY